MRERVCITEIISSHQQNVSEGGMPLLKTAIARDHYVVKYQYC